jgi:hypothetical protein
MSEPQSGLGLNGSTYTNNAEELPAAESLQFKKAEHLVYGPPTQTCNACRRTFAPPYFHVNGITVCPVCAKAIESGQNAPPAHSLLKAFIYGLGAAIAGSVLYAAVAIITGLELALIAILIGYMVGKAIRHASGGLGGRPQQILAVLLTYFAITTSYIPVTLHHYAAQQPRVENTAAPQSGVTSTDAPASSSSRSPRSNGQVVVALVMLALGAPFMSLTNMSGLISLLIIFFGLQRAWILTGRAELIVTGPYGT